MKIAAPPDASARHRASRLAMAALCTMWFAHSPAAQADDSLEETLSSVDAISLGISQVTPDGVQCGLEPLRLVQVARQTLDTAGIALRADAATRMTLSVITTQDAAASAGACATAVMLGVYRRQSYFNAEAGWIRTGYVVLWQRSIVQLTPMSSHPSGVAASVRRLTSQFVADYASQHRSATVTSEKNSNSGG